MLEVHQQEGEVVKHVDAGEIASEFDAVEQRRLAVDETDIAQMKIAMAVPHLARDAAVARAAGASRAAPSRVVAHSGIDRRRLEDRRGERGERRLVDGEHAPIPALPP